MLELLRIQNLALIEDLEVEFSGGMNVLTGETGAGKSFILKALEFLTGEKLTTDLVRAGCEKAVVEGLFFTNGEEAIIRRELMADTGRSRFYLNGRLSSQDVIRDMRGSLIVHTSQHGQQKLLQPLYQEKMLDDFMNRPDLLKEKDDLAGQLASLRQEGKDLAAKIAALEEKRDVLEFQAQEIEKVKPLPGEEEELESVRQTARNQAGIVDSVSYALAQLHGDGEHRGVYDALAALEKALAQLCRYRDDTCGFGEPLPDMLAALQDMERSLKHIAKECQEQVDIEHIEARLYTLAQLKRKLKRPLSAILALQEEISANLDFLDSCDLEKKRLRLAEDKVCGHLADVLNVLNAARQEAAAGFATAVERELAKLGFSEQVKIIFDFSPHVLHPERSDCVELRPKLLWQPNPGQAEQPLDRIASGGELSRFLLAVVTLMSRQTDEEPTFIFDEVDAGVGGITLNRVAESLSELARARQMLLITHWPQLAQRGQRHFVVEKEVTGGQTYTRCRQLATEDIPGELARMAGVEPGQRG